MTQNINLQSEILAYRIVDNNISSITPTTDPGTDVTETSALLLPRSGKYAVWGHSYIVDRPGVYRFIRMSQNGPVEQRQFFWLDNEAVVLAHAITWSASHGTKDKPLSASNLLTALGRRKVILTCGPLCRLADLIGMISEIDGCLYHMKGTAFGMPTSHVLFEAYSKKFQRRVLFDLDLKLGFVTDGKPSSLEEVRAKMDRGLPVNIVPLTPRSAMSAGATNDITGEPMDFLADLTYSSLQAARSFYAALMRGRITRVRGGLREHDSSIP